MRGLQLSGALALLVLSWPGYSRADQVLGQERTELTAYTLNQHELSLGIWQAGYGVLDQVTVGTYVPTWFTSPILGAPIVNGFVKARDWFLDPFAVSAQASFVYLNADAFVSEVAETSDTTSSFLAVPIELSISMRVTPRFSASLQGTWTYIGVDAHLPLEDSINRAVGAAVATTTASMSLLLELRLSRVVALTLHESLRVWQAGVVTRGSFEQDGTRVDFDLEATQSSKLVGNVVPGVAFSWQHVNLQIGLGYGNNWLPIVRLPSPRRTFVPELDFFVRF